jgi:hypothetical protein
MRDFACVCVDFVLFPIVRVALSKCLAKLGEMVPVLGLFFAKKRATFVQNIKSDSETLVFL